MNRKRLRKLRRHPKYLPAVASTLLLLLLGSGLVYAARPIAPAQPAAAIGADGKQAASAASPDNVGNDTTADRSTTLSPSSNDPAGSAKANPAAPSRSASGNSGQTAVTPAFPTTPATPLTFDFAINGSNITLDRDHLSGFLPIQIYRQTGHDRPINFSVGPVSGPKLWDFCDASGQNPATGNGSGVFCTNNYTDPYDTGSYVFQVSGVDDLGYSARRTFTVTISE